MKKEPDKTVLPFQVLSWILSVFFFLIFLKNSGWLPKTPVTINDLAYLIVAFVFFVLPFISRMKLGPLEFGLKPHEGYVSKEQAQKQAQKRESEEKTKTAIELKILNTLWNRQVLKFPELDKFFTFRLNVASPEFIEFREAGNRLMGEGLISETDIGQFLLTGEGLRYCAKHYKEFPSDMWFKYIPLDKANLEKVRKKLEI